MQFFGQQITNLKRKYTPISNNTFAKLLKLVSLGLVIYILSLYMAKIYQVPVHYSKITVKGANPYHYKHVKGQSIQLSFFKDYTDDNGYKVNFLDSCVSLNISYAFDSLESDYFGSVMELAPKPGQSEIEVEKLKALNELNLYSVDRAFFNYKNIVPKDLLPYDSLGYAINVEYISTVRNQFVIGEEWFSQRRNTPYFVEYDGYVKKNYSKCDMVILANQLNMNIDDTLHFRGCIVDTIPQITNNHLVQNSFIYLNNSDSLFFYSKKFIGADQSRPNLFLTAEDVSQCIEVLELCLEPLSKTSTISELTFLYGGSAYFSAMEPKPDSIFVNGFMFYNQDKLDIIAKHGLRFHVTLPDMQNKQDFRIYLVTTLIALFIGIFCSVLHDLSRNFIMRVFSKHKKAFLFSFILFVIIVFLLIARIKHYSAVNPYERDYKSVGTYIDLSPGDNSYYDIQIEDK